MEMRQFRPNMVCVMTKRQPLARALSRALSREANTEVTKTAIHRLAAGGWLQKGVNPIDLKCPTLQQKKTCLLPGAKNNFDLCS